MATENNSQDTKRKSLGIIFPNENKASEKFKEISEAYQRINDFIDRGSTIVKAKINNLL